MRRVHQGPGRFMPITAEIDDYAFTSGSEARMTMSIIHKRLAQGEVLRAQGVAPLDDSRIEPEASLIAREDAETAARLLREHLG